MTSTYDSWLNAQNPPPGGEDVSAGVLWFEDQPMSPGELERIREAAEVLPSHALWDQDAAGDLEYQVEVLGPALAGEA